MTRTLSYTHNYTIPAGIRQPPLYRSRNDGVVAGGALDHEMDAGKRVFAAESK